MAQSIRKLNASSLVKHQQLYTNVGVRAMCAFWGQVPMGPPDVILGISEAYRRDTHEKKVNLGVGAYRDDAGKPWVLPSVKKAEAALYQKGLNHEYAPISGDPKFTELTGKLIFGEDNSIFANNTIASCQALSGTGALRLGLEFIKKFYPYNKTIFLPKPTWGNHPQMCNELALEHKTYRYFDPKTIGFDISGALEDINAMPERSVILLHACAHNPTGVDPNQEQWKQLSQAIKKKKLLVFFDSAYQGFASGDVDNDAASIRQFVKDGHQIVLSQSFAKNMGLYGERTGALHILTGSKEERDKIMSQLKILVRVMYSNPPVYGARLVTEILSTVELRNMWLKDVKTMADRIISMRKQLRAGIEATTAGKKWNHVTDQIGMFCYTGLKPDQVAKLTSDYHVYLTKDGRISMAGVSSNNVEYVAQAIGKVSL